MANKMEYVGIKGVLVDRLLCDKCGATMQFEGIMLTDYPPTYLHICPECHNKEISKKSDYPTYYLELSDGTMLEL